MKLNWKKIRRWLSNRNLAFVLIAAAAYLLWPASLVQTHPRPLPKAEKSRLVYVQDFSADVLGDGSSGWSRMWTERADLVCVKDGELVLSFSQADTYGAMFAFDGYEPRRIYEIHVRLKQLATNGALIVRVRKKGHRDMYQIAGLRLTPSANQEFQDIRLEFVAPESKGREVLMQLYQYDPRKDLGGTMIVDRMEILRW